MTRSTDRDEALGFLLARINYERTSIPYQSSDFKLDRMARLLERLDSPQRRFPAVHIAGTKGKGSTASMVAAMLQAAGHRVGLYTSPHLERLEERFNVDGSSCSEFEFIQLTNSLKPVIVEMDAEADRDKLHGLTFFEITTAMAMLHFARRKVDVGVLEVGLGGRLDSTNLCCPIVSVITSISLDHTALLGETLPEIAAEKAGIIKPGVPVVTGVTNSAPREVIERTAERNGSDCFQLRRDFEYTYRPRMDRHGLLDYREPDEGWSVEKLELPMIGEHQAANAAVAIASLRRLAAPDLSVSEASIRRGLLNTACPARVELVSRRPCIIVDTAHNVASVEALLCSLREHVASTGRRTLLFATSHDKDARSMLASLLPLFDRVVLTQFPNNPRAMSAETLYAAAQQCCDENQLTTVLSMVIEPAEAWRQVRSPASPDDLIVVAGSFFLAAELRGIAGGAKLPGVSTTSLPC